jgi:hypothetical protein
MLTPISGLKQRSSVFRSPRNWRERVTHNVYDTIDRCNAIATGMSEKR